MITLGIDPSTRTGLAVVGPSQKVIYTREVEFKKLTGFERIQRIVGEVEDVRQTFKPDLITIESMYVGAAASAVTVIQVASLIRYFLWQEGVAYTDISPSTLKKFVCGAGNAKKEQVMMWVSKRWGFESQTNNIADAVGLAMAGQCLLGENFGVESKKSLAPVFKEFKGVV